MWLHTVILNQAPKLKIQKQKQKNLKFHYPDCKEHWAS